MFYLAPHFTQKKAAAQKHLSCLVCASGKIATTRVSKGFAHAQHSSSPPDEEEEIII